MSQKSKTAWTLIADLPEVVGLSEQELQDVSGGDVPAGWKFCPNGTTAGGGAGTYPDSVVCKA